MQTFLWFLKQLENKDINALPKRVCFVVREPQIRLYDFLYQVLARCFAQKLVVTAVSDELETLEYDQSSQLGLFGWEKTDVVNPVACWLQGVLQPSESAGFVTQAQRNAELSRLLTLFSKNIATTYFFEVPAKEFETSKVFFKELDSVVFIKLPEALLLDEFVQCANLIGFSSSIPLEDLFGLQLEMSLDSALMIFDHASCVSKRTWENFKEYSFGLLLSASQLRDLSESFWTRNNRRFFNEWRRVREEYSDSFWVAYWSNQLFLAYFYIDRASRIAKISPTGAEHGLSPSFTWKNGWKKYSKHYCERLHSMLYEIDCELKNGSDGQALEFLFNQHFLV